MSETTPEKAQPAPFNGLAKNRFEFTVLGGDGLKYDTAHQYSTLSDERYVQWLNEFNVKGNEDSVSEEAREATCRLWDDLVPVVENVEYDPESDWKAEIDHQEKIESMNKFLAVAILEPDEVVATGKRVLGRGDQTVVTECWFNGECVQQKHVLRKKTFELEKKYSRIQGKRYKQESTKGLRRKPKVSYIPQDEKIGELYDEMKVSVDGFAEDFIPLRFKTAVIHHVFDTTLEDKNLGK